jgi:uncharacterized membrane protein
VSGTLLPQIPPDAELPLSQSGVYNPAESTRSSPETDAMNLPVDAAARVLHILAAILLLGGALFTRLALMPAAAQLPDEEHAKLREAISRRWRKLVALGIAVLIFTGFYNYLWVLGPRHSAAGDKSYHMWMGIKILLAFVAFFFASALAGRAKIFEGIRRNSKVYLTLTIVVSVLVVVIAGVLKVRG